MSSDTYSQAMWALNEIVAAHKAGSPVVRLHLNEVHDLLINYGLIGVVPGRVEQDDGSTYLILLPSRKGMKQVDACRRTWVQEIEQCCANSSDD